MNGTNATLSRRSLLKSIPLGALGASSLGKAAPTSGPAPIKLAWNANAVCLSPVPLAQQKGIFAKHNLNVEFVNYAGSTDELLEAISTGKADAGARDDIAMAEASGTGLRRTPGGRHARRLQPHGGVEEGWGHECPELAR